MTKLLLIIHMPPLSAHLHLYCERLNDSLWGEPINAISNIGFFIAGWLLVLCYRKQKAISGPMPEAVFLIALTFIVGAGSLIFHTVATMGAALFDVIPIVFFIFLYLYVFTRSLLGLGKLGAWGMFLLLAVLNIAYKYNVYRAADGYVSYIPTFIFLTGLSLWLLLRRHPSALPVLLATVLALVSLYCRMIDREVCHSFPLGTHFLWHGFNAVVMYILVREIIIHKTRGQNVREL